MKETGVKVQTPPAVIETKVEVPVVVQPAPQPQPNLIANDIFSSTPATNSPQLSRGGSFGGLPNTTTQLNKTAPPTTTQKSNTFASLPTSVRKDLETKSVINSIFDDDPFAPSNKPKPVAQPPQQPSQVQHHQQHQYQQHQQPQQPRQPLNNIEFQQTPYQVKNEATITAVHDIFGSNKNLPYTTAGIEPRITNPQPNKVNSPVNNNNSNNVPKEVKPSTQTPPATPTHQTPPQPTNITPAQLTPIPQPSMTPSVPQPTPQPSVPETPVQVPVVKAPVINLVTVNPTILSYPDPCVSVFVPPRDGGVQESVKTRKMQEKLFVRWINYYVGQRGIIVENLATEFADGVVFIHLLECYTRVLITDETKAYCTPYPANNDEKYLNFYSGLVHLAYLQKPVPPINIIRMIQFLSVFSSSDVMFYHEGLISGDIGAMLDLLWFVLYRIEIEQKSLQGMKINGAIMNNQRMTIKI